MYSVRKIAALAISALLLCGICLTNVKDTHFFSRQVAAEQLEESLPQTQVEETTVDETEPEPHETPEAHETPDPEESPVPETAEASPSPVPTESSEIENDAPAQEETVTDGFMPGDGRVSVGAYTIPSAMPGDTLTLAIPIEYAFPNTCYKSNADDRGGIVSYQNGHDPQAYDQSITGVITYLQISLAQAQEEDCPLVLSEDARNSTLIAQGVNNGYAVFENIAVQEDVEPGVYPVRLQAMWQAAGDETWQSETLVVFVKVEAAEADVLNIEDMNGEEADAGTLLLGGYVQPSARAGETLTLALPVRYTLGEETYISNAGLGGGVKPYESGNSPETYDQAITGVLKSVRITVSQEQEESFPLDIEAVSSQDVVSQGENKGYAVFLDVPVWQDALPGEYTVQLLATWQTADSDDMQTAALTAAITVEVTSPDNCICCVHCVLCYTEEKLPAAEVCACIDGDGSYLGCGCECPIYVMPEADGEDEADGIDAIETEALQDDGNTGGLIFVEDTDNDGDDTQTQEGQWVYCDCDCHWIPIMPLASVLMENGDGGVIVFTFAQLKEAIESTTYNPIYLGYGTSNNDGETLNSGTIKYTSTSGISVKRSITLIGTDPRNGKQVTLEDYNGSLQSYTMLAGTAGITVRLQDMNVIGYNFYGIVGESGNAINLELCNVTYVGRQPVYAPNSTVSFTDCDITLQAVSQGTAQELAEAASVQFEGTNTVKREGNGTDSIIWLRSSPYKVTVNGELNIDTNSYFIYTTSSSNSKLDIYGTMDITTSGSAGCMVHNLLYIGTCNVYSGGTLNITHNNAAYASLIVGTLTVEQGGTLTIDRTSSSSPCISASTKATFTSPQYVRLYNPYGNLISGTTSITTQVINRWTSSNSKYIWNNNDLSKFTTTGSTVTDLENGKGAAYGASALASNFSLSSGSTKVTFGQYSLTLDTVYAGSTKISGTASGGTQTIAEYAGDNLATLIQSATASGNYQATMSNPIGKNNYVYVKSITGDLEAHIYSVSQAGVFLYEVPDALDFGMITVSTSARYINRADTDWTISVIDTRDTGDLWQLYASAEPMQTASGLALDGGLVFTSGTDEYSLHGPDVLIAAQPSDAWNVTTEINWPEEEGFRLYLNGSAGVPGASYSSTITWTLTAGP